MIILAILLICSLLICMYDLGVNRGKNKGKKQGYQQGYYDAVINDRYDQDYPEKK